MKKVWETEGNGAEFEAFGLPCVIKRHPSSLHLCGYVGVPEGHPLHGVRYDEESPALAARLEQLKNEPVDLQRSCVISIFCASGEKGLKPTPVLVLRAHGGITFSRPGDGEYLPKGHYWFGFDCAHSGDWLPSYAKEAERVPGLYCAEPTQDSVYRDMDYVRAECQHLAAQLGLINKVSPDWTSPPVVKTREELAAMQADEHETNLGADSGARCGAV